MKKLIILALLLIAFPVSASFDNNLYYGIRGNAEVFELQEFLTAEEVYLGPITGNFYSLTLAGVKNFQTREGITPVYGYFGPLTRTRANEILASHGISDSGVLDESGEVSNATTAPPATVDDVVAELQSQIQVLMEQLIELQKMQLVLIQQNEALQRIQEEQVVQSEKLGAIEQSVEPKEIVEPVIPEPVKELTIQSTSCNVNMNGVYCDVYVFYLEDEIKIAGTSVVAMADDGIFQVSSAGSGTFQNPATKETASGGYKDGKPFVHFVYFPESSGPRIITFNVGDLTATSTISGQVEQCAGQLANTYTNCNPQ